MEARSVCLNRAAIGRLTKAKSTLPRGYYSRKLFRAGILRRFKSLRSVNNIIASYCRMRHERLIHLHVAAVVGLIRRASVASDVFAFVGPISLHIGHGNVTNALPHPLLITLLKRYHPHLLPGLITCGNWWVFPSRIKFPTAGG